MVRVERLPSSVVSSSIDSELSAETVTGVSSSQWKSSWPTLSLIQSPRTPVTSARESSEWSTTEECFEEGVDDTPTSTKFEIWDDEMEEVMFGSPATDIGSDIDEAEEKMSKDESKECTLFASGVGNVLSPRPAALSISKTPSLEVSPDSGSWVTEAETLVLSSASASSISKHQHSGYARAIVPGAETPILCPDRYEKAQSAMHSGLLYEMACQSQEQRLKRMMGEVEKELEWLRVRINEEALA